MAVITSNSITFIDETGAEKYLYIRYSNDGVAFTANNGLTPGDWLGTCTTNSTTAPTDFKAYQWSKIRGEDGQDGIPGTNGVDGKTTYFHVKYSNVENPTLEQMTEIPSKYIGTYVDYIEDDSENPADYKWVKFTGDDGIPGTNGIDGKTHYLHIKYSNDGGKTFTDNNGEAPGEYLGVYTDEIEEDSTDITKYTWSLIKGKDAITYYTWIKYADDAKGTNMSDLPDGKEYMGIAYNKEAPAESNVASDYIWSLIKGSNGIDGDNGVTYYTWIKYADDDAGSGMSDDPTGKEYIGISYNNLNEEESENPDDYLWSLFKGADGIDGKDGAAGKGIKSMSEYYLISPMNTGITVESDGWSTEIPTLDKTNKYLWNYEVTEFTTGEVDTTEPVIIGAYGDGISSIVNYYAVTSEPIAPEHWIKEMPPAISDTNKYLWNYEEIFYTDGTSTTTEPAIIGVRGDNGIDGSDSVDFQIYSVNGFEFSSLLTSIELKTVAFKAGNKISNEDATYQWKWWNSESTLDDKYEIIADATSSTLVININDIYAFSSLKCEMTYDGTTYEDYAALTEKTTVYTAVAKFFNGTNIISAEDDYLIVYIELYKDNELEELLYGNSVYKSDANSVQGNVIITDIDGEYSDGDTMYFVCKNTYEGADGYDVILGKYTSEQWNVSESNYIYKNDLFAYTTSPVVFVPKEKISRSLNINFEIYDGNTIIARTAAMVLDFNDPTISNSSPVAPKNGQLWLDTSVSPSILKMWDGSKWVNSGYQNGNVVYTSKPEDGYSAGDLWILSEEDAELFGDFGPGTMLKATVTSASFDSTHWVDVDEEGTEQKNNIKQYFLFNKDTGLRIGQSDDQFYVNISSTEMGFYDATSGTAQKVVSISNQSATIKNLTVEDSAKFNCEVQFGNFILKTESNGSLSLALAT